MDKSNLAFKGMIIIFKLRDFLIPRKKVLKEVNIKPGFNVLEYGCGSGSYTFAVAELVGTGGTVYALDILPVAIQRIEKIASKKGLSNIKTICSDCATGLEDNSIDVILLYDTFHLLSESDSVLQELHRILKPNSILSFSDHHIKEEKILTMVTKGGLFKFSKKGKKTYGFVK